MAEAASGQMWAHTSAVLALLANLHRDHRRTRAFQPADFNPHLRARRDAGGAGAADAEPTAGRVGVGVLKRIFVDNKAR